MVDSIRCFGVESWLGIVGDIADCADLESSFSMDERVFPCVLRTKRERIENVAAVGWKMSQGQPAGDLTERSG